MSDLIHPKVKEFSADVAKEFNLDEKFTEFVLSDNKPLCFEYRVENPSNGWTCYLPDEVEVAYPLWSCNADQTLLCVDKGGYWFARGYHDDHDLNRISNSHQGLLADLFISLYESEETDFALKEAASASGFRFLEKVLEFLEQEHEDHYGECEKFVLEVDILAAEPPTEEELKRVENFLYISKEETTKREIPATAIESLKNRGLVVSEPYPLSHSEYACGLRILKPIAAGGNSHPFEIRTVDETNTDGPIFYLFKQDDEWALETILQVGSKPPIKTYQDVDGAIDYLIDLFFGAPDNMRALNQSPYDNRQEVIDYAITVANQTLANTISLTEGVISLASLSQYLGPQKDLVRPFHGWSGRLSLFPVGDVRKRWNPDALAKFDAERDQAEAPLRAIVTETCQHLIQQLS